MAEVVRQSQSWYAQGNDDNPRSRNRHTGPTYIDDVGNLLLGNFRERVHIQTIVGGDAWAAHEAVECVRRLGLLVDGKRGGPGYTLAGFARPVRWTRLDGIYLAYMEPPLPMDVEA